MKLRTFVLIGVCVAPLMAWADPLLDEPVAELTLTTGAKLYDARAKSFGAAVVMVKHRDGAQTVRYEEFPQEFRDALLAKKPQPAASSSAPGAPAAKPKPVAAAAKKPEPKRLHPLMVQTFRVLNDYAAVEVYNDSDQPVSLAPFALVGEVASGETVVGRRFVAVDESGRIVSTLAQRQSIKPRTSVMLHVVFERVPEGTAIARVQFRI
jgi:hypothetical protein